MALPATDQRMQSQADLAAETLLSRAHQQAILATAAEMAAFLQSLLGQRITAYITGSADAKAVGKWARGERRPSLAATTKLRDAYHVAILVAMADDEETARAWFLGMNPSLRDRSPAYAIRELPDGGKQAMDAARYFVAHG